MKLSKLIKLLQEEAEKSKGIDPEVLMEHNDKWNQPNAVHIMEPVTIKGKDKRAVVICKE